MKYYRLHLSLHFESYLLKTVSFTYKKISKGFEHYIAKTGYRRQSKSKAIAQRTLVQSQQAESSYLYGQQNGKVKTKCQKAIFIKPLPKHKFRSEEKES